MEGKRRRSVNIPHDIVEEILVGIVWFVGKEGLSYQYP